MNSFLMKIHVLMKEENIIYRTELMWIFELFPTQLSHRSLRTVKRLL